jgi:hypothetical protein
MRRNTLRAIGVASVLFSLGVFTSSSAFADGLTSTGSTAVVPGLSGSTVVVPGLTATPDGCPGVLVYEEPLEYAGNSYGEIELWYDSCDRDVKAVATASPGLTLGQELEACLNIQGDPGGGTCAYLFNSGSSVSTGWESDANIETQAWGWLDLPNNADIATGQTLYY